MGYESFGANTWVFSELDSSDPEALAAAFRRYNGKALINSVSGKKEITAVTLQPEVVDPDDIEMLQDLIVAAANALVQNRGIESRIQAEAAAAAKKGQGKKKKTTN